MQEQDRLAGGRGAFERGGSHTHDHPATFKIRQDIPEGEGPGHGVELIARLGETRCRRGIEVGSESDDQDIGFEGPGIGDH